MKKVEKVLDRWFSNHSIKAKGYNGNLNHVIQNRGIMGCSHQMELLFALDDKEGWDKWAKKMSRNEIGKLKQISTGLFRRGVISSSKYREDMRYYKRYFKIDNITNTGY